MDYLLMPHTVARSKVARLKRKLGNVGSNGGEVAINL